MKIASSTLVVILTLGSASGFGQTSDVEEKAVETLQAPFKWIGRTVYEKPNTGADKMLNVITISNTAISALDMHSTIAGVRSGCCLEANPIWAPFLNSDHPRYKTFVALGAGAAIGHNALLRLLYKHSRKGALILGFVEIGAHSFIVGHNYQLYMNWK